LQTAVRRGAHPPNWEDEAAPPHDRSSAGRNTPAPVNTAPPSPTLRPAEPSTAPRGDRSGRALPLQPRLRRLDALLVGLAATVISGAFSWVPSLWFDEAATVVAATRSWSDLWQTVQNVDAVHVTWYAVMHLWFDLVGYSPLTLRLPSVVFTGVAAGLLVVLASRLTTRRIGVTAGLLFAVLPRTTLMATEGRTFALSTLLAIALTLVLHTALNRALARTDAGSATSGAAPRAAHWWWLGYAALTVVSTWFFLYLALVVVAHALTVALVLLPRRADAAARVRAGLGFVSAAVVGAAGTIPVALLSARQSAQVGWIEEPSWDTVRQFFVTQWSPGNIPFAWVLWVLLTAGVVASVVHRERLRGVLSWTLPWLLLPGLALLAMSFVLDPLWSPRYQTFSTPALAILMAAAVTWVAPKRAVAAVVVGAMILSGPSWWDQRQPTAKDRASWNQVAELIGSDRSAETTDIDAGIVWGPVRRHPTATSRIIQYSYPEAFVGLDDFTLKTSASDTGRLWEEQYPLENVLGRTTDLDVVWLVTSDRQDWRPRVTALLATQGFTVEDEWNLPRTNVLKFSR
jgi:mannosyltransferase